MLPPEISGIAENPDRGGEDGERCRQIPRVGFQKSVTYAEEQFSRCPFLLVDQATKNRPTLDPFIVEVPHGVARLWRAKFAAAVRPSTVVVPDVLREHHTTSTAG